MRLLLILFRCDDKVIGDDRILVQDQEMCWIRGRYISYEQV
jgi:hypothetical protein